MYTDAQLRFSDAQSLAGAAATTVSTNTVDNLAAVNNLGIGWDRRVRATIGTAFTGGTSVQAQLIESASANLSSPTVLASGPVVLTAAAISGAVLFDGAFPNTSKRYLGMQYITVGTTTTGTVNAGGVLDRDAQPYLPSTTGR